MGYAGDREQGQQLGHVQARDTIGALAMRSTREAIPMLPPRSALSHFCLIVDIAMPFGSYSPFSLASLSQAMHRLVCFRPKQVGRAILQQVRFPPKFLNKVAPNPAPSTLYCLNEIASPTTNLPLSAHDPPKETRPPIPGWVISPPSYPRNLFYPVPWYLARGRIAI